MRIRGAIPSGFRYSGIPRENTSVKADRQVMMEYASSAKQPPLTNPGENLPVSDTVISSRRMFRKFPGRQKPSGNIRTSEITVRKRENKYCSKFPHRTSRRGQGTGNTRKTSPREHTRKTESTAWSQQR